MLLLLQSDLPRWAIDDLPERRALSLKSAGGTWGLEGKSEVCRIMGLKRTVSLTYYRSVALV